MSYPFIFFIFKPYSISVDDFSSSIALWIANMIFGESLNFSEFSFSLLRAGSRKIAIKDKNPRAKIVSIRVNPLFFKPSISNTNPYT